MARASAEMPASETPSSKSKTKNATPHDRKQSKFRTHVDDITASARRTNEEIVWFNIAIYE
jgi:hypothetical protein